MSANNTRSSLDALFKRQLADKINMLVPETATMTKLYPSITQQDGREYLEPVNLTHEHGFSYGAGDGTVALNASIASVYAEAKVTSSPIILVSRFGQDAANRMLKDDTTFMKLGGHRAKVMKESMVKRAEIAMLYAKKGIAAVSAVADGGSGDGTFTVSAASWSPAIWGGMEGAELDVWDSTLATPRNTVGAVVVTSVDPDTRIVTVSGTEADLDAIQAGDIVFFRGSKANDMTGLDTIVTNTGNLFNISATTYQLWKSSSYATTGALTFGKILKAAALPVARGGLDGDAVCLIPPRAFEQLNEDYAAYRQTDSSYKSAKGENGVEALDFHYQAGRIQILPAPYVKEGDSFIFPKEDIIRVGAKDFSFGTNLDSNGEPQEYFTQVPGYAAYEMRAQYDFTLFCRAPAKCVKISGVTYA